MRKNGYPSAVAWLRGGKDFQAIRGMVRFFQRCDGVLVEARVWGLPQTETGFFGFHIHEGGSCRGEGFPHSGGHFNPDNSPHPNHAGDLPPLLAHWGRAYMQVLTGRFRVEDLLGRTVILHRDLDDFHTQPAGNPGAKIACGVIRKM